MEICPTEDNLKGKVLVYRKREEEMNFILILMLKYALFTAAMFLTGMVMCYFFDGETDRLKNE